MSNADTPVPPEPLAVGTQQPTRVRLRIAVMLFITIVINYLDRSNLSVAATDLARDLNFSAPRMGQVFSAFGWAYALLQIPGGWLVDRVRPRVLYATICALWSAATILQGFAGTFLALFGLRLLLGICEAPAFPICNRVVTTWFPDRERAAAIACYTSGQFVGIAFLLPVLAYTQKSLGWQYVFIFTGAAGLVWAALWYLFYRDPHDANGINDAEIDYIRRGGGLAVARKEAVVAGRKISWRDWSLIVGQRKLWGVYLGQYAVTSTLWFFLTWFPTYLVKYRHMDFIKAGFLASLPFLAAFCGVLSSGFLSDFLIKRGVSPTVARKFPIITGLLLSTSVVGANYVSSPNWVIVFLTIAFFGTGFASITWVLVSSLAPRRLLGLTGGVFNFCGNLASITVPLIIGYLVKEDNFAPALVFVGGLGLLGALSYIFLVGRVERIADTV
jgi:ACS family D-galactonate transporter-like MFS transporter